MALSRREFLVAAGAASAGALACQSQSGEPRAGGAGGAASAGAGGGRGMVASSQRFATDAGVEILRAGGNAADAAVAVAAALNVTEPTSTGLGGDCFALYYDASTRAVTALNGSGRAPAGLTIDLLRSKGITELPPRHPYTVTAPGACAGWCDLIEKHGALPMATILAPAIRLAEEGFAVADTTAHFWAIGVDKLRGAANLDELMIDGRAPRAGERFRNPGLARTLRAIAAGGKDAFYRGEIASAIARVLAEVSGAAPRPAAAGAMSRPASAGGAPRKVSAGVALGGTSADGILTAEDLAAHESTWDEPISTTYRGVRVWECPPNGQGITALVALNILEGLELAALPALGAERLHLLVEAMRLAFADTRWYVADPRFAAVPLAELLSKDYAAGRRKLIDPSKATADVRRGSPVAGTDTVYFCVVDGRGNACSFINSNYMGFGTGIVPAGWGFTLQNRGHNFSLDPAHPNALAPRKRPYHTIIPGMLTRADGSLLGPFGVMGGFMQPQGHVQVVVGLIDDGLSPQAALDRPRFCVDPLDENGSHARLNLEGGIPADAAATLSARGHVVKADIAGYDRALFGRGQIILRDAAGRLTGGTDPRADGSAAEA